MKIQVETLSHEDNNTNSPNDIELTWGSQVNQRSQIDQIYVNIVPCYTFDFDGFFLTASISFQLK